ncbi:hypothetical protein [Janibacter cremeus]|uniref:Lipoprotein n=1 Tax=Janibacter cremeus TaxID=1285192 RepID=A0A852VR20_9MICO|nr:hypothetical protein [Janibacter cremeus]NYF97880.1 hypothetical protein [Janibacter cremeus]
MRGNRIAASLAGVAMIVVATGCGGAEDSLEGQSGPEIMERVQEDMGAVSSVSIAGEVEQDSATRELDLALDEKGNYEGTISFDEVEADVLIVDHRLFVQGEEEFWSKTGLAADDQMAGSLAGMWVALPGGPRAGNDAAGIDGTCTVESFMGFATAGKETVEGGVPAEPKSEYGGMCDLESFMVDFTDADWDAVTKGETTEVDGDPALELIAENEQGTTRMWVSTGQDNHVLKVVREGAESDEFTLGDYNEPVEVSVPDEDEILDLAGARS